MSFFKKLNREGLEDSQDRLGGSRVFDTDVYQGTVKLAYAGASDSGAQFVEVLVDIDGREYKERLYITNKKGENFFTNKQDPSKKIPLPGFVVVDDFCLCASGIPLSEQEVEDKTVKLYSYEAKAEVPTKVPVLTELIGKSVTLAIAKKTVDKTAKDASGEYQPTGETREENNIEKVFNSETKQTVVEATKGEDAAFMDAWAEKNKGKVFDRTKKAEGKSARPAAGGDASPRKSLFGKK